MTDHAVGRRARPLILIVDDHEDSGEVCAVLLQACACDTLVATDARQAVALAIERRPDTIITDIGMPGVDGWWLMDAVKTSDALKDIPIVVVSGYADAATRARASAEGCAAFIPKPLDAMQLVETLSTIVGRQLRTVSA